MATVCEVVLTLAGYDASANRSGKAGDGENDLQEMQGGSGLFHTSTLRVKAPIWISHN